MDLPVYGARKWDLSICVSVLYAKAAQPRVFHAMPCCFVVTTEGFSPRSQIDDNKLCRCQTAPTPHEALPLT